MHKVIFLTLTILVVIASATAIQIPTEEEMNLIVDYYNDNMDQVPKIVITLFGNERMNLYVDNELVYGAVTKNGKITEVEEDGIEKPTLNVYSTGDALQQIAKGEMSIEEAISKKYIDYKGVGFVKRTKFGLTKSISRIFF